MNNGKHALAFVDIYYYDTTTVCVKSQIIHLSSGDGLMLIFCYLHDLRVTHLSQPVNKTPSPATITILYYIVAGRRTDEK